MSATSSIPGAAMSSRRPTNGETKVAPALAARRAWVAEKIRVTGDKLASKLYWRHSGYPGGIKSRTLGDMLERRPEEVIRKAVKGMLPRNRLARQQLRKLKVYAGPAHPHQAQQPKPMEIED